ncbi:MAG TPA: YoaK family protein [Ktedonobacteraceae bacterium]
MSTFLAEARQTLVPRGEVKHGPLPPLLVAMTLVTGLVDAFSYLVLGHVFVANMTGNVVFLAFALAGAPGFSILASLVALGSFVLGSFGGGLLGSRLGQHRGHLLSVAATLQALFLCTGVVLAALAGNPVQTGYSYGLIIVLGIAMGLQNAIARKLAVPDLTTTVLTLTIVGIAADSRLVGGSGSRAGRRLISVIAMFVGALVGSLLIFHAAIVLPLVIALIVIAVIAGTTQLLSRTDPDWVRAS